MTGGTRYITTPAGVRIGCAYTPPAARVDRDHQRLQAALLDARTAQAMSGIRRVFAWLWSLA